jgi:hypothetical protein
MNTAPRFVSKLVSFLMTLGSSSICFAQVPTTLAKDGIKPGYVRLKAPINVNEVRPPSSTLLLVLPAGATSTRGLVLMDANSSDGAMSHKSASKTEASSGRGPNLAGLDTVPTFTGAFASPFPSVDPNLNGVFPFIMIGNQPLLGGTTEIPARLTAVSLQLLNASGSVKTTVPVAPFEDRTEDSPVFQDANYSVGRTQFGDAILRAEFFNMMRQDWHTRLNPQFVSQATVPVPTTAQVQFPDGKVLTVPGYMTSTAADGSTVVFILDVLFMALDSNQAIADINTGNFTTTAVNYHVYPNALLFSVVDEKGDLTCCILGFHTFFFDPTVTPEPRWIYSFASWVSPGTFPAGTQDVVALSHETSELLNDPFVNTIVPTWQFPGEPANSKNCQDNLETGDPVEMLANETVAITTHEGSEIFTYHPQTEALLQWFQNGATSNAIGGAFSYPNTKTLTRSAIPCPQ